MPKGSENMTAIQHPNETQSNAERDTIASFEPRALRTFTPSQAILAKSAGIFHWTPEGRRLYDFSSGVLVANLGHNPTEWMNRFVRYMGWQDQPWLATNGQPGFFTAAPMTAYNAATPIEAQASRRLIELLQSRPGGKRLEHVLWAASGSEAVQKALWAALARDRNRDIMVATRFGFHGKKGLAGAVTGSEKDRERDPRVRFISFPMEECLDVSQREAPFDPTRYSKELEALRKELGSRLCCLITEPYLGGAGSYHPPAAYLQLLERFCRQNDMIFILDEVQSNFGRTRDLFAFETYGIEPDVVVLGKGLGNGVPVAAAVGQRELFGSLEYGEGSDTWSANPLCCAAVQATLDIFAHGGILEQSRRSSAALEDGLLQLKRQLPIVARIRGERGGMVWGVEMADHDGVAAADWANAAVAACYLGEDGEGIHFLGPLAKKVLRVSPPLVITESQASEAVTLMQRCLAATIGKSHNLVLR